MKRISKAQKLQNQAAMNEGMAVVIATQLKWKHGETSAEEAMNTISCVVEELGERIVGDATWKTADGNAPTT